MEGGAASLATRRTPLESDACDACNGWRGDATRSSDVCDAYNDNGCDDATP